MIEPAKNFVSKAFHAFPWLAISGSAPSRDESGIDQATGGVSVTKPTISEVLEYAEDQIKFHLRRLAFNYPPEHQEEMAQEARLKIFRKYDRLDPNEGWMSFVQYQIEGAIKDYKRAGRGFQESRESLKKSMASGKQVIAHRLSTYCESEEDEMDLDRLIAIVKGREIESEIKTDPIDWDMLARLARQDKGLHIFIRHVLLEQDLTELAPVFGVTRERCGQLLREFAGRIHKSPQKDAVQDDRFPPDEEIPDDYPPGIFNDPSEVENPWVNAIIYALGLGDVLGVSKDQLQKGLGDSLKEVDFDSFEPLYPPEAKDEERQLSWLTEVSA